MQKSLLFVFLFITITLNAQVPNNSNYGDNSLVGTYANIRGIKMYYEIYGTGEPLLLIHGNSGSIANMTNQIDFFSKKYKVIVADSRDHGKTLDTLNMSDTLSYEMMADDYNALLAYLKVDSAYVIGWSDGGINALILAMNHPNTVKKIVAMGANLWSDTTAIEPFFYNIFKMQYTMLQKKPMTTENKVMLRHYKIIMTQPNISLEQLKKISCPAMIVAGDHDAIKIQHTALIAQNISNSNLWIAPNAGHGLMVFQYKDKFNAEVEDFFIRKFKKIQGFDMFKN